MADPTKILAFCCHWCSYAAADLAGIARLQYPSSIRIIRVTCSGMVHPDMVLQALEQGAAGVLIVGCPAGECHYQHGNEIAKSRAEALGDLLEDLGYERSQVQVHWISSAEPEQLVEAFRRMDRELGLSREEEAAPLTTEDQQS